MDNHVLASCCLSFVCILLILGQVSGLEIGGEPINRPLNDTRDNSTTIINPDQTIGIGGLLVGFKAFMLNTKDCIWLHVWRKATRGSRIIPTSRPHYTPHYSSYTTPTPWWRQPLPGITERPVGLPAVGYPYWMMIGKSKSCVHAQQEGEVFSYNLPADQYIRVERDDVIGFSVQSSNPIPYSMDNVSCSMINMSLELSGSIHARYLRQHRIYSFAELHECRTYSLTVTINQKECKHIVATRISQNLTITTTGRNAENECWILQSEAIANGSKAQTEMKLNLREFTRSCSKIHPVYFEIREGNSSTSPKITSGCQKPNRFSSARIIRPITTGSAYVKFTRKGGVRSVVNVVLEYFSITIAPCIKVRVGETPSLIESPGYPYHDYPSNTKICWSLFIPNNSTERIRVVLDTTNADFQPPNKACRPWDNSCLVCNDFIEVRDGNDSNAPMLAKWCNDTGQRLIETSSKQILTIYFVSDGSVQRGGFQMKAFTVIPETVACFHYIGLSTPALIESPHYPNSYPGRRNDCWSIRAGSKNQSLLLTIKDSYLGGHTPNGVCATNMIEIRDGVGSTAPLLRRWCRKTIPEPILSSGPYLFIHFVKDRYNTARFALSYQQIKSDACTTYYAYSHIGYLNQEVNQSTSLGVHCWVLRSEAGQLRIRWHGTDQQASGICNQNYIQVHDGDSEASSLIGRFCSDNPIPASGIESNGSALYIEWVVTAVPAKLQIGYTALSLLNCVITLMNGAEMYMTHKGPEYINNRGDSYGGSTGASRSHPQPIAPCRDCKYKANTQKCWRVSAANPNDHLLVKVIFLELQDKNNQSRCVDFLELHDGESGSDPQLAMLCGSVDQMNFTTTGRVVRIMFQTDDQVELRGFRLEISQVRDGGCTFLEAKNYNLSFDGSRFPGPGPLSRSNDDGDGDRCWTISSPSPALPIMVYAGYIRLGIDQALLFYDGPSNEAPLIRKFDYRSGQGSQVVSSGGNLTVVLETGRSGRMYRFLMSYAWLFAGRCQYISLSSKAAYLKTTGFGLHNYTKNDYKCWVLTSLDATHIIDLTAESFVLENTTSCSSDYLDIYDGPKRSDDKLLHRWCGNQKDKVLARSSGRSLYVAFSSNGLNQYPGFSIKASAISPPTSTTQGACVYLPISDMDYIATKNYGIETYPNNDYECWSLTAVEPHQILEIHADIFLTEYHDTCSADYLDIYDGPAKSLDKLLHRWCGAHSGQVLAKSSGRSLYVVFKSDDSTQYPGFKLVVTAVDSSTHEEKVIETVSQGGEGKTSTTTIILLVMVGCVLIAVIVIIACWVFRKKKNQTGPTPEVVYTTNSNNPMSLNNLSVSERGLADGTQMSAPENTVKETPQITKDTAKLVESEQAGTDGFWKK